MNKIDDLESAIDEAGMYVERLTMKIDEIDDNGVDRETIDTIRFYAKQLDCFAGRILELVNELEVEF